MTALSLLFPKPTRTQLIDSTLDGEPILLEIDTSTQIVHDMTATPTTNPIEDGSNVADHVTLNNKRITINGVISNSPLSVIQSLQTVLNNRVTDAVQGLALNQGLNIPRGVTGTLTGSIGKLLVNSNNRVKDSFSILEQIRDKRMPIRIVTKLTEYENVILTNISVPQTARDGNSLRFTAVFEQINLVKTLFDEQANVKDLQEDIKHTASKLVDRGKRQATETTSEIEKGSSLFFKAFKAVDVF